MAKHSTKRVATEREAMVTCMTKTQQQAATSRHVSAVGHTAGVPKLNTAKDALRSIVLATSASAQLLF
jgi:hypothetical protein